MVGMNDLTANGWLIAGLVLAALLGVLSAVAFSVDASAGWIALWVTSAVAGTVFSIGVIGKAVEVGVRSARR